MYFVYLMKTRLLITNFKKNQIMKIRLYFLLLGLLFVSSCRTLFRITVQEPAMIDLPNEVTKIVVVDNTQLKKLDFSTAVDEVLTGEQFNGDKEAANQFPDGMMQSLSTGNYTSVRIPMHTLKTNGVVNYTILDSIFTDNAAQAIIVLDKFDSDAPIGGVIVGDAVGATQSSMVGRATMSVYCQNRNTIENVLVTDRFTIPTSGTLNPLAVLQDVANKRKWYSALGRDCGSYAGTYFYTPWVWVNRQFYNKGNIDLRRAKKMIFHGNWAIAEKKLTPLLNSNKQKVKARASFNLALVYEGQGRLNDAVKMAERSALEFNCKQAPSYLQILQNRQTAKQVIDWQQAN